MVGYHEPLSGNEIQSVAIITQPSIIHENRAIIPLVTGDEL